MLWRRKAIHGCVRRTGPLDLLMAILARKVKAIIIASVWIKKKLVDKEGF